MYVCMCQLISNYMIYLWCMYLCMYISIYANMSVGYQYRDYIAVYVRMHACTWTQNQTHTASHNAYVWCMWVHIYMCMFMNVNLLSLEICHIYAHTHTYMRIHPANINIFPFLIVTFMPYMFVHKKHTPYIGASNHTHVWTPRQISISPPNVDIFLCLYIPAKCRHLAGI